MVKITIPKSFGYPTAVFIVNHKRHVLQTGVEIEVDEAIAEVVNNAIALKPKKDPDAGKLSHDDLENRPFGEVYVDTLTFDGNPTEESMANKGFLLVSDTVVTKEDCANGCFVKVELEGEIQEFLVSGEEIQSIFTEDGFAIFGFTCFIPYDGYTTNEGNFFPKAGVYMVACGSPIELTIPNKQFKVIKKIDEKYLPVQPHLYAHYFSISPSSTSGASGTAHIFLHASIESTEKTLQSLRDLIPSTVTAPKYYPVTGWYVANSTQYAIVGIQSMNSDPTIASLYLKYINPSAGSTIVGSINLTGATVTSHECHQIF